MKKLKVATIIGTRPEIIRLSRVISELEKTCNHTLIHTGQNYDYELNEIFFNDLQLRKPDYFLNSASANAMETIGKVIAESGKILKEKKPDAVLILGDTNSCMSAIAAKRLKIPVFHMEAGNRCFDQRVPEEINRKIVDHVSDINLPYSDIAREYLIKENFPHDQIIKTGSPMLEVLDFFKKQYESSKILKKLKLESGKYFVVSCHREENVDEKLNLKKLIDALNAIQKKYNLPIIFSTHPRTRKQLSNLKIKFNKQIKFLKPLGFHDYINLQVNSFCTLSDSGTISEESAILGFNALNIRENHERPEAMEESSVMMVGFNEERILQAIKIIDSDQQHHGSSMLCVDDYEKPNVSKKVVRIIHSYVDYINKKVWKK